MQNFIETNDSELEAHLRKFPQSDFSDGHRLATEAANKKFDEDVKPVLENCRANLEKYKFRIETEIIWEESEKFRGNLKLELSQIESALTNLNNLMK